MRRRRRRKKRTCVNPRVNNDVGINPSSKLPLHRLPQRFISTEGTASLQDNRLKTHNHAKTVFSGCRRNGRT
eukprot:1162540-Pyramimonas_sp.AAC.1